MIDTCDQSVGQPKPVDSFLHLMIRETQTIVCGRDTLSMSTHKGRSGSHERFNNDCLQGRKVSQISLG